MTTFQRLIAVAALAGSLAGVLVTIVHQVATVPLILRAEAFEEAAASPSSGSGASAETSHVHDGEHAGAWQPHDGFERIAATALADIATGIGFALLLVSLSELSGQRLNWRRGLYWGLGGFAAVAFAPALGLPPELPGTESAALLDRQVVVGSHCSVDRTRSGARVPRQEAAACAARRRFDRPAPPLRCATACGARQPGAREPGAPVCDSGDPRQPGVLGRARAAGWGVR